MSDPELPLDIRSERRLSKHEARTLADHLKITNSKLYHDWIGLELKDGELGDLAPEINEFLEQTCRFSTRLAAFFAVIDLRKEMVSRTKAKGTDQ